MLRTVLGVGIGWIGISMLADGLPALVIPHRMAAGGDLDAATLGITTLVALTMAALVQPAAGLLADRLGRAPVIAAGTVVAVAGLAVLFLTGAVIGGAILAIAGAGIAQAGYQPLVSDRVEGAWRGRAAGLKNAFDVGGAFVGFVVLGALLGSGQATLALVALSGTLLIGFAAAALLLRGVPAASVPHVPSATSAARGALIRLVIARFSFLLGIYVLGRFLLLFLADRDGVGADAAAAQAGAVLALLALLTVAASVPSGWLADRLGRGTLMLAGGALAAAGIALVPATSSLVALLCVGALVSAGSAAFGSASWAMLADLAPSPDAGRTFGLANLGTAGAAAAAGAFGLLVEATSYAATFGTAAALALAGGALGWQLVPRGAPAGMARPLEAMR